MVASGAKSGAAHAKSSPEGQKSTANAPSGIASRFRDTYSSRVATLAPKLRRQHMGVTFAAGRASSRTTARRLPHPRRVQGRRHAPPAPRPRAHRGVAGISPVTGETRMAAKSASKGSSKRGGAKKAARKGGAKKSSAKKSSAKKASGRKSASKGGARKASAKKATGARKTGRATKGGARKSAAKKSSAKKSSARKTGGRGGAKKASARKSSGRKRAASSSSASSSESSGS